MEKVLIQKWIIEKVATKLACENAEVDIDTNLTDFGFDSTEILLMMGELESKANVKLKSNSVWYYPTINKLSAFIEDEINRLAVK